MHRFTVTILFLAISIFGLAQKNFEGTVVYTIHDTEGKGDKQLTVMFGREAIKIKYGEKDNYDKEVLLINVDSGKLYTINEETKTYTVRRLVEKKEAQPGVIQKVIAGFQTKAVDLSGDMQSGRMASVVHGGTFLLYRSDSLFYAIPAKYSNNPELIVVYDNHVALGADITIGAGRDISEEDDYTGGSPETITIFAKEITPEKFSDSEFRIGTDFKKFSFQDLPDPLNEKFSPPAIVDTARAAKPKPIKKSPAKPIKKVPAPPKKDLRKPE